jgi:FAD synthetase
MNNSKIVELQSVTPKLVESMKRRVLVGGCFDIFHFAHLDFLKKSKAFGDNLVVALESDEFIRTRKGREPFHDVQKRASLLAELECVSLVVILPLLTSDQQYLEMVESLRPSVMSLTDGDPQLDNKTKHAQSVGATIKVVPLLPNFSSTIVNAKATITSD